jgi:invasion protein IalB
VCASFVAKGRPSQAQKGHFQMEHRVLSRSGTFRRIFSTLGVLALGLALISVATMAQQPTPKAQPKPIPKSQSKGGEPKASAAGQQDNQQPQLFFSPWTKICQKGPAANDKPVCITGKSGRVESGMPVAAAMLIEPEGEPRKILRITLPLGMALPPGTRVVIDQGQPMQAPYVICMVNGCISDYEASQELVDNLKKGKGLALQGINGGGQAMSLVVPLNDFAKAHDGPPSDPKVLEEQEKSLPQPQPQRPNGAN